MIYRAPMQAEFMLTEGVMSRRIVAWFVDAVLLGLLILALCLMLLLFGLMTLGLSLPLLGTLPFVPFLYHVLSLLGAASATPGQRMLGLTVRRDEDLGPPSLLAAVVSTLVFYLTLATSGLLLLVALFTTRHRTLHDLLSGLVVVRVRALSMLTPPPGYGNIPGGSSYA